MHRSPTTTVCRPTLSRKISTVSSWPDSVAGGGRRPVTEQQKWGIWARLGMMISGPILALCVFTVMVLVYCLTVAQDSGSSLRVMECARRVTDFTHAASQEREASVYYIENATRAHGEQLQAARSATDTVRQKVQQYLDDNYDQFAGELLMRLSLCEYFMGQLKAIRHDVDQRVSSTGTFDVYLHGIKKCDGFINFSIRFTHDAKVAVRMVTTMLLLLSNRNADEHFGPTSRGLRHYADDPDPAIFQRLRLSRGIRDVHFQKMLIQADGRLHETLSDFGVVGSAGRHGELSRASPMPEVGKCVHNPRAVW